LALSSLFAISEPEDPWVWW